jgi:hypothetical protein
MKVRALVLVLAVCFVGCGDDDDRSPDGGPIDAGSDAAGDAALDGGFDSSLEDVGVRDVGTEDASDGGVDAERPEVATLAEVADVFCASLARIRCTTPTACACPRFGSIDFDVCIERETSDCRVGLENRARGRAIAAGRVATDLATLASCTAALEASYARCTGSVADLEARCFSAFLDLDAGLDESCAEALCAGGEGFCARDDGRCRARPGVGENCDVVCAEGLVCAGGRCREPGAVDAACVTDAECASPLACLGGSCRALVPLDGVCGTTAECARGLRCTDGACRRDDAVTCVDDSVCAGLERCGPELSEGRCRAQLPFDAVCESPDACADGRCDFDVGRCASPRSVGEPCGSAEDCIDGLVCTFDGTCEVPGAIGESCVAGAGSSGCAEGLGCFEGVCGALSGSGARCDDVGRCAEPFVCRVEIDGPRCGAPRSLGETCASSGECGDARCDVFGSATCVPALVAGDPCFSDEECAGALACQPDPVTFAARCAPRPELGERCTSGGCPEGAYCRSEPAPRTCEPRVCDELFLFPIEEL